MNGSPRDSIAPEQRFCPECGDPIADHELVSTELPNRGEVAVLFNLTRRQVCWRTAGRIPESVVDALARPGQLPRLVRRPKDDDQMGGTK